MSAMKEIDIGPECVFIRGLLRMIAICGVVCICQTARGEDLGVRCTPSSAPNGLSMLVGPFTSPSTGDGVGAPTDSDSEPSSPFPTIVEGWLRLDEHRFRRGDIPFTVAILDRGDSSRGKDVGKLLRGVFAHGTSTNALSEQNMATLKASLREIGCDFVVGGQLQVGRDFTVVVPYLLDVSRGTLEVPFDPVAVTNGAEIDAGKKLATGFIKALARRSQPTAVDYDSLLIGCFTQDDTKESLKLADILSRSVAADVSADPSFGAGVRVLASEPTEECRADQIRNSAGSSKVVLFSGAIARDGQGVQPRFDLLFGDRKLSVYTERKTPAEESTKDSVQPDSLAGPPLDLSRQYLTEVETFIAALSLPTFQTALRDPVNIQNNIQSAAETLIEPVEVLLKATPSGQLSTTERDALSQAFALAYRVSSNSPDDTKTSALAHYVLGVALLQMSQIQLAIDHLNRSFKLSEILPARNLAQRNEAIGRAYAGLGEHDEAITFLENASTRYERDQLLQQAVRVRRTAGEQRMSVKDYAGAKKDLEFAQRYKTDFNVLTALGFASLRLNELDGDHGALQWYTLAIAALKSSPDLSPQEAEIREAKIKSQLSAIYGALAKQLTTACNYDVADQDFRRALEYQDDPELRYRLGINELIEKKYGEAAKQFSIVTDSDVYRSFLWTEGAWLNLIEAEILGGNFSEADATGERANHTVFSEVKTPDPRGSRFLVSYMRTVARAVNDAASDAESLRKDNVYMDTVQMRHNLAADIKGDQKLDLNWNNELLTDYYRDKLAKNPERLAALAELDKDLGFSSGSPPSCPDANLH